MPTTIHPTAIVEPGAQLGADCEVHPYAIVKRWAVLGDRVIVHPFAVVGGDPQDLKFDGACVSWARIGSGTRIREHVTVNRATQSDAATIVGEDCLLMAACHVAHDCTLGRRVIVANAVLLAGHITVGDHAVLGGGAGFHQFIRIGEGVMAAGGGRFTMDLPPYVLATERDELIGLNLLGLKRRGLSPDAIRQVKEAFRTVYFSTGKVRELAAAALASGNFPAPEARKFLEFFGEGKRGFVRPRREVEMQPEASQ